MHSLEKSPQQPIPSREQGLHNEFLLLIETHRRMVLKVCWAYAYSSDDRDDLLQEILTRLWASFHSYDRTRQFSTWMYRVALNVAIDNLRRRQRRIRETQSNDNTPEPESRADSSKNPRIVELRELMEHQSEVDRALLLLFMEGNTYREIGEVMGMRDSNVGSRLSRLKKSLRDMVQSRD